MAGTVKESCFRNYWWKKGEIWLSFMTKAPISTARRGGVEAAGWTANIIIGAILYKHDHLARKENIELEAFYWLGL